MMVDTSPAAAPRELENASSASNHENAKILKEPTVENGTAEVEETQAPAAAPAVRDKPRKTWAHPKAPPKDSVGAPKKSLLDIIAEEEKTSETRRVQEEQEKEERIAQEEEAALMKAMQESLTNSSSTAAVDDEMDQDLKLALMLSMREQNGGLSSDHATASNAISDPVPAAASAPSAAATAAAATEENALTKEEMKEIENALKEADAAETAKSLQVALELQQQEDVGGKMPAQKRIPQGNVRTMNREEFLREQGKGEVYIDYDDDLDYDDMDDNGMTEAGYRINSAKPSAWLSIADGSTVIGPNQEMRTKHDPKLQAQANAYRLEVRADDETGERAHVGNKAYNAFHRSMQKKTVKGVAAHGHGRATADTDKTREGALDGRVRLQIARAVNNGLIEDFHGCVKEGKEALVFHAGGGAESEGFDVAVKVFKRIQEFKNRGEYVAGDPRYGDGKDFRNARPRQQLEQWAEKEHRNLVRAYRANVPVPKPLWTKENVLFLRFLGEEGWPSPQLRELDIKKGSKKWTALYEQTMSAMQRLYCDGRLIHGDLSEYNILVCPSKFLKRFENSYAHTKDETEDDPNDQKMPETKDTLDEKMSALDVNEGGGQKMAAATKAVSFHDDMENPPSATMGVDDEELQVTLIDFGQAVDQRHPEAEAFLQRDVLRVKQFFDKMGITTISVDAAMAYIQTKDAPLRP